MAPGLRIQPRAGGGSAARLPVDTREGAGRRAERRGDPRARSPSRPAGARREGRRRLLCANLRAGLLAAPPPAPPPPERPPRPARVPGGAASSPARSARPGPRRPGTARPLRSHRPRFCLRGAGAPPSPAPSRPRPSPSPRPLPPLLRRRPSRRPFLLPRPAPRTLVLGARLPDPPEPPRAARRRSCQDGDPAARVARGLPPRGLRAAAAQEPPQGALAQPGPGGRELLQQRQAAGLQRQRLAAQEGQAGARKAPRSPRSPAPRTCRARTHPSTHPPTPGRPGPSAHGDRASAPPCNPGFPACTFWRWGPGCGEGRGAPSPGTAWPPRASAPWGSSAPGLGARG